MVVSRGRGRGGDGHYCYVCGVLVWKREKDLGMDAVVVAHWFSSTELYAEMLLKW